MLCNRTCTKTGYQPIKFCEHKNHGGKFTLFWSLFFGLTALKTSHISPYFKALVLLETKCTTIFLIA